MSMRSRVLFIGIDAAEKELIRQWAQEGLMPTFAALFDKARIGTVTGAPGLEAGSVWSNFYTGQLPGRHGRYSGFRHFESSNYTDFISYPKERVNDGQALWTHLSKAGKKCVVVDAPYTYVDETINGAYVCDWGTHARRDESEFETWPPELAGELASRFGNDVIGVSDDHRPQTTEEYIALRDNLLDRLERRTRLNSYLMERQDWDFFLTVYCEVHPAGHLCWHLHDKEHYRYSDELVAAVGNPLKDVYLKLDESIGRLLSETDDRTEVFVFTSHGMGPMYSGTDFLDDILRELDTSSKALTRDTVMAQLRATWKKAPAPVRNILMPLRNSAARTASRKGTRRFFEQLNNNATGGVRINLVGRERHGRVAPGKEYDELCAEITAKLQTFTNADTGEPLIEEIIKTRDVYTGEHVDDLPDLLLRWNRPAPIRRVHSPLTGELVSQFEYGRSGDHTPDGLFFAVGPSFSRGLMNSVVSVVDLAPTVLSLLGVDIPNDKDGSPINEVSEKLPELA